MKQDGEKNREEEAKIKHKNATKNINKVDRNWMSGQRKETY